MPSVPKAIRPPVSMMSRTRQMPLDRRRFEPGSFEATAPESAKIAQLLVRDPHEVLAAPSSA